MFLHIGLNIAVDVKDIVAIVNLEGGRKSKRDLLNYILNGCEPVNLNIHGEQPKSLVVLHKTDGCKYYLSPISSLTLKKRNITIRGNKNEFRIQ